MKRILLLFTLLLAIISAPAVNARDAATPPETERAVNVRGAVNQPGRIVFPKDRGLTIVAAISLAGGHSRYADLKRVRLTRKNSDGTSVTTVVDVDAIMKSRNPAAAIQLGDGDSVEVPPRDGG